MPDSGLHGEPFPEKSAARWGLAKKWFLLSPINHRIVRYWNGFYQDRKGFHLWNGGHLFAYGSLVGESHWETSLLLPGVITMGHNQWRGEGYGIQGWASVSSGLSSGLNYNLITTVLPSWWLWKAKARVYLTGKKKKKETKHQALVFFFL